MNGLIIQWGLISGGAQQTLPTAFSNSNYSLVLVAINLADTVAVYYKDNLHFTPPRSGTYNYIAIGY